MHLEAPLYNDSLIGSSLQSGIREVFYLCMLGKTQRDEACFCTNDLWFDWSNDRRAEPGKMSRVLERGATESRKIFQVYTALYPPSFNSQVIIIAGSVRIQLHVDIDCFAKNDFWLQDFSFPVLSCLYSVIPRELSNFHLALTMVQHITAENWEFYDAIAKSLKLILSTVE